MKHDKRTLAVLYKKSEIGCMVILGLMAAACSHKPRPYPTTLLSEESPPVRQNLDQNSVLFVTGGIVGKSRRVAVDLDSGYAAQAAAEQGVGLDIYTLPATATERMSQEELRTMKVLAERVWWNGTDGNCKPTRQSYAPTGDAISTLILVNGGLVRSFAVSSCLTRDAGCLLSKLGRLFHKGEYDCSAGQ